MAHKNWPLTKYFITMNKLVQASKWNWQHWIRAFKVVNHQYIWPMEILHFFFKVRPNMPTHKYTFFFFLSLQKINSQNHGKWELWTLNIHIYKHLEVSIIPCQFNYKAFNPHIHMHDLTYLARAHII